MECLSKQGTAASRHVRAQLAAARHPAESESKRWCLRSAWTIVVAMFQALHVSLTSRLWPNASKRSADAPERIALRWQIRNRLSANVCTKEFLPSHVGTFRRLF